MEYDKLREGNRITSYIRECQMAKDFLDEEDFSGFFKIIGSMQVSLPEIKGVREMLKAALDKKIEKSQKEFDEL